MCHELNPECSQHIEKRRFQIIAVGIYRKVAVTQALVAAVAWRLLPGEQLPADELGIRLQQTDAISMPVLCQFIQTQPRKGGVELHIAAERHSRRAHQGIDQVIADACQSPVGDQLTIANLSSISTDILITLVIRRQPHRIPLLQGCPGPAIPSLDIGFIGQLIKQVELDQFDALVFEIHQRAVNTPSIGQQMFSEQGNGIISIMLAACICRCIVVLPVYPRRVAVFYRLFAATAAGGRLFNLTQEPF